MVRKNTLGAKKWHGQEKQQRLKGITQDKKWHFLNVHFADIYALFDYWIYGMYINVFSGGHITCKLTFPVYFKEICQVH